MRRNRHGVSRSAHEEEFREAVRTQYAGQKDIMNIELDDWLPEHVALWMSSPPVGLKKYAKVRCVQGPSRPTEC